MPYEATLDKQVFSKSWEGEGTKISVSIYSYNGGISKLQISRENVKADGEPRFATLERMTKEVAAAVLPNIQEAIEKM